MIIFKLIGLFIIFAACVGVGFNISRKYSDRVRELKAMVSALNVFEEKIKFTYEPIPEIFAEIGESFLGNKGEKTKDKLIANCKDDEIKEDKNQDKIFLESEHNRTENLVGRIFAIASSNMKTMFAGEAWEKAVDSVDTNFTKDDLTIINSLAKMLGKTDLDGQVSEIRLTKEFLNTKIDEAEVERNKNSKLYKTLGITVGLGVVIILI